MLRPALGGRLFDVAGPCHFANCELLAVCKRFVDSLLTGESRSNLLTDEVTDALELRDRNKLDASVRYWVTCWVCWVHRQDRINDGRREWCGLDAACVFLDGDTCAGRNSNPTFGLTDKFKVLGRG